MNEYKNRISILRNILQKSNDQDLIDHVFKKFYMKYSIFIWRITLILTLFIILITAINYIILIYTMNYLNFNLDYRTFKKLRSHPGLHNRF